MSRNPLYYVVALGTAAVVVYVSMLQADAFFLNPARIAVGGLVGALVAGLVFQYDDAGSLGPVLAKSLLAGVALGGTYYGLILASEYDTAALAAGEAPTETVRYGVVLVALAYLATLVLVNVRRLLTGAPEAGPTAD